MGVVADAMRMANDPPKYFGYSGREAHQIPRADAEALQAAGLRQRFADLRDRIAVLKSAADEQGIQELGTLQDAANLLFPHTVYKSYPASLLDKNRFDQLTKWLSRLTTVDLGGADVGGCDGVDSWLQALEDGTGVKVAHSSGTTGTMSFLPRTAEDYRIRGEVFAMTSRDFNGLDQRPDLQNAPWHCIFLGFRGGRSEAGRSTQWLIDHFAGSPERLYPLYDIDMSSDVMFMAARVARAEARGELDRLEVSPQLRARQAEFETVQKDTAQAMDRMFETMLSLKGERVYVGGMTWIMLELAERGLARGYRDLFGPNCIVQTGGGAKGRTLAEDWERPILEFTGARRIGQYYGMTEVMMITSKCSEGHYHIPPWVVTYVLDPDSGRPLPREGVQTGRAAFFDLVPQTYWGGFATGDEITADWTPCPCGRTTAHIHSQIQRYSEKRGGDDKITCAAADEAHAAAIDFLARSSLGAAS